MQSWALALYSFFIILFIAVIVLNHYGLLSLFDKQWFNSKNINWIDKGPTPLGEKKYTPQGLTSVNGRLIFANTWKSTKSRVYEFDVEEMTILRFFDMPDGANHTSGLAWDGKFLWAVDYISNKGYCIDLESSFQSGIVQLLGDFELMLKGTSACCIVNWKGKEYLAVSDFMNSRKTYFILRNEALKKGSVEGVIEFEYENEGFSQGLEFINGFLYESENKFGKSIINMIDMNKLEKTRNSKQSTIKQFLGPSWGIEDLAFDGEYLWTSDEVRYRFFKTKYPLLNR